MIMYKYNQIRLRLTTERGGMQVTIAEKINTGDTGFYNEIS